MDETTRGFLSQAIRDAFTSSGVDHNEEYIDSLISKVDNDGTLRHSVGYSNGMSVDRDASPPGSSGEPGWQHHRVPVTNNRLSLTNASGFTTQWAWLLSYSERTEKELCKSRRRRTEEEKKAAHFEAFGKKW